MTPPAPITRADVEAAAARIAPHIRRTPVMAVEPGVRSVLVTEEQTVAARRLIWDRYRMAVEHGTAAGVAALTSGVYRPEPGERIALLLCGANTDPADLTD